MRVCPRCAELYPDDVGTCPTDHTPLRTVLDPLIGRTVGGRFRMIQRLGSGGMSSVYLARHVLIDRLMAIKALRRDLARDPVQRDRFLREARAVNRINHDNIVEITDFGETEDGLVYLVMEYVPGEPLLRVLAGGPFSALRALDIAEQCGHALGRAHQMGVIHRDLKPENILLVQRPERPDFVKLLDFGIAKILDAPSLTGSQQIFGTPGYIAPEYIQSTAIDGRSDLYSLGCILYEMVTGALPFDYEYPGDLLVKHVTEMPIRPSERHPGVEPPVEQLILRCLAKDPAERFRDAFHFLTELESVRERLAPEESAQPERSSITDAWFGRSSSALSSEEETEAHEFDSELRDELAETQHDLPSLTAPYGISRDAIELVGERSEPPVPDRSLELLAIPQPPALDGPIRAESIARTMPSEPPLNPHGLVASRRWRERFDAIRGHLHDLVGRLDAPPDVLLAMGSAEHTLAELEDAVATARAYQEAVEVLHVRARDFRSTLGRALDGCAAQLSRRRGEFEDLAARRTSLRTRRESARIKLLRGLGSEGEADALLWELAGVEDQLRLAGDRCRELETQLAELTVELEVRNEQFERDRAGLVQVLDAQMMRLEPTASALRRPLEIAEAFVREAWKSPPTREQAPS